MRFTLFTSAIIGANFSETYGVPVPLSTSGTVQAVAMAMTTPPIANTTVAMLNLAAPTTTLKLDRPAYPNESSLHFDEHNVPSHEKWAKNQDAVMYLEEDSLEADIQAKLHEAASMQCKADKPEKLTARGGKKEVSQRRGRIAERSSAADKLRAEAVEEMEKSHLTQPHQARDEVRVNHPAAPIDLGQLYRNMPASNSSTSSTMPNATRGSSLVETRLHPRGGKGPGLPGTSITVVQIFRQSLQCLQFGCKRARSLDTATIVPRGFWGSLDKAFFPKPKKPVLKTECPPCTKAGERLVYDLEQNTCVPATDEDNVCPRIPAPGDPDYIARGS
ncbi:hypothetical protein BP5796_08168 [Coleophoma crateriformis]|uniref:Uncharacterized protein n=1 Tax=Coleophoma crateriformis TaxID=565419 RepID=A0A3D8RE47_9HELO|nr:hypothetical protein BP5796_08168 [Coleophoma crateriformis]